MENVISENTSPSIEPRELPSSRPDVQPFDYDLLPKTIADFVRDTAARQQCPPDFIAVTALCGLSGVLGNKAYIYPKQNDNWKIIPNLWGTIVGRPSAMKSPAMKAALEPLKAIEKGYQELHEENLKLYETDSLVNELTLKEAKKKASAAIRKNDNNKANELIADANAQAIEPPELQCIVVVDTTYEKLGVLLDQNPNGLLLTRDELPGLLSRLMKEEYQTERAFYLECFDGDGTYKFERITRKSIVIEHCTLSLIGGIQPAKLAPLIRGAVSGVSDDGLIQRLQLAVWPDDNKSWKWLDQRPDEMAYQQYDALFNALLNYKPLNKVHRYTPEAQQFFIEWMEELQHKARHEDTPPTMESYMLKLPKSISAIALIFELVGRVDDSSVTEGDLQIGTVATTMALDWADYLISHANRIFSSDVYRTVEAAKLILKQRDKLKDVFKCREIQQKGWTGLADSKTISDALDILVDYNHIVEVQTAPGTAGGRPSTSYYWVTAKEL
ncbi:YfjI family protein [Thalassotalea nanhaiensis]|uniref:YfjI family protein n=1 Tax=Thalassotalea nanhaiensis TaxID=3065648 RepID=A0ABY9TM58_9GAMM|nr:YfjI family protein [Colwelliaceae bacterium SQ345]